MFINKVLKFFGLITIRRAKSMFVELSELHDRTLMKYAQEDFGAVALSDREAKARAWAESVFEDALADDRPDPVYITDLELAAQ